MLTFVIPALNEEQNLPHLFSSIERASRAIGEEYRIVLVNDGSTDGTVALVEQSARALPIVVLSQERNKGVGPAFDLGFRHIASTVGKKDLIVTMEADNTSDLAILRELVLLVEKEECDVALASCYATGGAVVGASLIRRILSSLGNGVLRLAFPIRIRTWSSFYRVYRGETLKRCYEVYGDNLFEEPGFACVVELLVKMRAIGLTFKEVPMVLRPQKRIGSSKMKIVRNILAYLRIVYRYRIGAGRYIWTSCKQPLP